MSHEGFEVVGDGDNEPRPRKNSRRRDAGDEDFGEPNRGSSTKWILIALLGGLGIAAFACCGVGYVVLNSARRAADEVRLAAQQQAEQKRIESKEAIEISAHDLSTAYRQNPALADQKYKGRNVRFTMKGTFFQALGINYWKQDERDVKGGFPIDVKFKDNTITSTMEAGKEYTVEGICDGVSFSTVNISKATLVLAP